MLYSNCMPCRFLGGCLLKVFFSSVVVVGCWCFVFFVGFFCVLFFVFGVCVFFVVVFLSLVFCLLG